MKYKKYIAESPLVSEIGLGSWQLGNNSGWKNMSEPEAIALVEKALEMGVNFFDTAPNYGHGSGEIRLGNALKGKDRSKIVINTKFGHSENGQINFNAARIRESLEGSLKRLQVDYIDSIIMHNPPFEYLDGNKTDHYEIFERLIDEGKICAYGASLDSAEEMKLLMQTTNARVIEAFFNIFHQDTSLAFDLAIEKEVAIIAKIPLDSGWLSGKYNAESTFSDIRSRWTKSDIQTRSNLVEQVKKILNSEDHLSQKAISFCLGFEAISTVIPGNVDVAQLMQNLESTQNPISQDMIKNLQDFYLHEVKKLNLPW
uniref:aldo/keto reductase n=1 Tax=Flavobacterium sp. TaxID=239 RepID=UPI00404AC318